MMKKLLQWGMGGLLFFILLGGIAWLSLNTVARFVVEKRWRAETGMEAHIEKLSINLREQRVRLHGCRLINPPEFGGGTFVHLPELEVQYDWEALRNHELHLKLVRFHLAEIHLRQSSSGKLNTSLFSKLDAVSDGSPQERRSSSDANAPWKFAGLDTLEITLGWARFTSELHPHRSFAKELGIRNKVYRDIQTEKDLQNVAGILVLQAGFNILMEKMLSHPE